MSSFIQQSLPDDLLVVRAISTFHFIKNYLACSDSNVMATSVTKAQKNTRFA